MKNLTYLMSNGHSFMVDDQNPFVISRIDLDHITRVGQLVCTLFRSTMDGLKASSPSPVSSVLFDGLSADYQALGIRHPQCYPVLTRIDLMVDTDGNWKIAEIDPSNKHGMGFALATRYESGAGERQKLLSLLEPHVRQNDITTIVIGRKESFYTREQKYFAGKLQEHTGRTIDVMPEDLVENWVNSDSLMLDFPICHNPAAFKKLSRFFLGTGPGHFINPPRHMLGGKALMTLPYEHEEWLESAGMGESEIVELRKYLPPTYLGPFIGKEVFSSGAKGVFFDAVGKKIVFQKYIPQRRFSLGGEERFIRMACHFVGSSLGELTVTATKSLPVHGGNDSINYHVVVKE
mgnify:FL=1